MMADNDNNEQRHVARMIVRDETRSEYILPPPKPSRPSQEGGGGGGGEERKAKTESVERSNSRVTARVSNLMRWPRTNKAGGEKDQVGGGGQLQQTKNSFV